MADGAELCLSEVTWVMSPGTCFFLLTLTPPFLFDFLSERLGELAGSPPCLWLLISACLGWSCSARHSSGLLGFEAGTSAFFPCSVGHGVGGCWWRGVPGVPAPSDFSLVIFNISEPGPMVSPGVAEASWGDGPEERPGPRADSFGLSFPGTLRLFFPGAWHAWVMGPGGWQTGRIMGLSRELASLCGRCFLALCLLRPALERKEAEQSSQVMGCPTGVVSVASGFLFKPRGFRLWSWGLRESFWGG